MWQLWLIIFIILLLMFYFYPNVSIFFFLIAACLTLILAFFKDNLIITTLFSILTQLFLNSLSFIFLRRFHHPVSLSHTLLNQKGIVLNPPQNALFETGTLRIHHHTWIISSNVPLYKGQVVNIIAIQGIRLIVSP